MTAYDDSLVIETEAGEERAFVMDSNVRVPAEASPGRRVTVTYRSPGGARAFAYYLQYENQKQEFFKAVWNLWNRDAVAARFEAARRLDLRVPEAAPRR